MASKAKLQLQRVREITKMLGRGGGGGQQLWKQATSSEFLVQMGYQARSKLEEEMKIIISQRQQPMHDLNRNHCSSFLVKLIRILETLFI